MGRFETCPYTNSQEKHPMIFQMVISLWFSNPVHPVYPYKYSGVSGGYLVTHEKIGNGQVSNLPLHEQPRKTHNDFLYGYPILSILYIHVK